MVVEISLKLLYCTMCEKKIQIYGVHIPSKSNESSNFYLCPSPLKTPSNSCDLPYRQKRIIHPPSKHPFENLFPTTAERGREKLWFDLSKFSQKIWRWLETCFFYILYDLQFFQMWWLYSFANKIYHIVWY